MLNCQKKSKICFKFVKKLPKLCPNFVTFLKTSGEEEGEEEEAEHWWLLDQVRRR
jgi:hypothetical protein